MAQFRLDTWRLKILPMLGGGNCQKQWYRSTTGRGVERAFLSEGPLQAKEKPVPSRGRCGTPPGWRRPLWRGAPCRTIRCVQPKKSNVKITSNYVQDLEMWGEKPKMPKKTR